MKELQIEFIGKGQVKGFKFTQIKKTKHAYIYRVNTGDSVFYEVFKRRENNKYNCVSYPSNKAFGVWAKTTSVLSAAYDFLEEYDLRAELLNKNL